MSSGLSSAPSDSIRLDYSGTAGTKLDAYQSRGPNDFTVPILQACVDLLPLSGSHNILEDIMQCQADRQLRQLASNIHTGLLMPSG